MQFVSRAVLGCLMLSVFGCEDVKSTPAKEIEMRPSGGADDGAVSEPDSGSGEPAKDAASACEDDPETPGNDCSDAVACHETDSCGLESESCCVPGLNVAAVACVEGLTCTDSGRATCDGPEDCNGNACCVDITAGTATCSKELSCNAGFQLCHNDDQCGSDTSCNRGKTFTWWGLCN